MESTWTWSLNPINPSAGDNVAINVFAAPSVPVKVEVRIDNVLLYTLTINDVPGTADCTFPQDSSGKPYSIRLVAGVHSDTRGGTVQ